jgi:VanZ family protein
VASYWLPVILWAGLIYFASTRHFAAANTSEPLISRLAKLLPAAPHSQLQRLHVIGRKFGHWFGYFVLALLLARAIEFEFPELPQPMKLGWTAALVSLYAVADEFHQSLVPNREGSVSDVLIDVSGGLSAIVLTASLT